MRHHRRILAVALSIVLLGSLGSGVAAGATPAATFITPIPGIISVTQTTSFTASWKEASGVAILSRTVVVQTSRPLGRLGCDSRWAPMRSIPVTGTSMSISDLAPNRCYRFLLVLATSSGKKTIASSPLVPSPYGMGATAIFTNPYYDGAVAYDTRVKIGWAQRDTFGSRIVSRSLIEQFAPAVDGSCTGVSWSGWASVGITTTSTITRTLQRAYCYRYRVTLQDALGYRSEITSGALMVAAQLPEWTGSLDLYRPEAFASQATKTWCVAASSQMMLNIVLSEDDISSNSQSLYIKYAQANDAGNYSAGSDPAGWAATLNRYGGGGYTVTRFSSSTTALKQAALRMRLTNKPVGMLVWSGRHAWVMNGFTATADPATTSDFTVTSIFVSGPLYPRAPNPSGYDLPPDTELTPGGLAHYFTKYTDSVVKSWNGYYLLILP